MTRASRGPVLALVPALNEEESVGRVVAGARGALGADVVVVDDGSSDATADVARRAGAIVLSLPFNVGVGGAIRTGLRFALERGYDRVVQLDGDGQHDPHDARRLLEVLDRDGADLVVGSRFAAGYQVSAARRGAMGLLAWLVSRQVGTRLTDVSSGFRAMGRRAIATLAPCYPVDYMSDTVEALLLAYDAGLVIREESVRMDQRRTGRPSAGRAVSLYHLLRIGLVLALHRVRGARLRGRS